MVKFTRIRNFKKSFVICFKQGIKTPVQAVRQKYSSGVPQGVKYQNMDSMTVESKDYILSKNSSLKCVFGVYRGISSNASRDSISKAVLTIASLSLTKPIIPASTDEPNTAMKFSWQ